jgi:hypothetical protein
MPCKPCEIECAQRKVKEIGQQVGQQRIRSRGVHERCPSGIVALVADPIKDTEREHRGANVPECPGGSGANLGNSQWRRKISGGKRKAPEPEDNDDEAPPPRERKPRASRASRKRKSSGRARPGLLRLVYWGAVLGLWAGIALIGVVVWVGAHLPAIQALEIPKRPPAIEITGLDGSVLATRGEMPGANVPLKELPPYLPKAFIAIEDRRFYSHHGVDPLGILRAAVANVLHRGVSQGGSTLTQQLAKNLFLTQERTLQRKLQEVELAFWLERKHSKAAILELYLRSKESRSPGVRSAMAVTLIVLTAFMSLGVVATFFLFWQPLLAKV